MLPIQEGFYWAKLVAPTRVPPNETASDWMSVDFEPVEVFDNNGEGDEALMVMCIGRELAQHLHAFEWGEPIPARGSLEADVDKFLNPQRGTFKL